MTNNRIMLPVRGYSFFTYLKPLTQKTFVIIWILKKMDTRKLLNQIISLLTKNLLSLILHIIHIKGKHMYIDSHAHFDIILAESSISENKLINEVKKNSIEYMVQVSVDRQSISWSHDFAKRHKDEGVFFTAGIHPSSAADNKNLEYLSGFVRDIMKTDDSDLLFGIGECGLDYYRMHQDKNTQKDSFEHQIALAKEINRPLIIHSRDAMQETISLLQLHKPEKGIMHCFSGDREAVKKILDMGFYISFSGNLTYKNAKNIQDAACYVPLDRILLETDSPYLAPIPLRGKKNRPDNVIHIYNFLAEIKNESHELIREKIYENFNRIKP